MTEITTNEMHKIIIILVVFILLAFFIVSYLTPKTMQDNANDINNYESPFVREIKCAEFTKNCGINSEYSLACNETLKRLKERYFININAGIINTNEAEHRKAMNGARAICTKFSTLVDVYLVEGQCVDNAGTVLDKILNRESTQQQSIQYAGFSGISFQAKQNIPYCVVAIEKNHCFNVNLSFASPKVICGVDKVPNNMDNAVCSGSIPKICYYFYSVDKCGSETGKFCEIKVPVPLVFNTEKCGGNN